MKCLSVKPNPDEEELTESEGERCMTICRGDFFDRRKEGRG